MMSERWRVEHGDCRDLLRSLPDASIDSIVTDPPYELGFMGKAWDSTGIAAIREQARFIGIEQSADYIEIARTRIAYHETHDE